MAMISSENNDLLIIEKSKKGDKSAFEALVLKYQHRVYNICRYMLGVSDAEDAAQDVFIKIYKNLANFNPSPSFSAWVSRITVNTCIDYKRKPVHLPLVMASAEEEEYQYQEASNSPGPERLLESKQVKLAVTEAIGRLSDKLKAVIILNAIEGLSYEEISQALDISIGTVKSRLSRAREELKRLLKNSMEHI